MSRGNGRRCHSTYIPSRVHAHWFTGRNSHGTLKYTALRKQRCVSSWLGLDWQVAGVREYRRHRMTDPASSHTHLLLPAPPGCSTPIPFLKWLGQNRCKICLGKKNSQTYLAGERSYVHTGQEHKLVSQKKKYPDYWTLEQVIGISKPVSSYAQQHWRQHLPHSLIKSRVHAREALRTLLGM